MSRDDVRQVIKVRSPAQLLAVIPGLLGFRPERSLVVVGIEPPYDEIRIALRYDLPDPPDPEIARQIAAHALAVMRGARAAMAAAYGPAELVTPLAAEFIAAVRADGSVDLREMLRAENGRYWSYTCQDPACCLPEGMPFKDVPGLPSREELAASVAPASGAQAAAMREFTRREADRVRDMPRRAAVAMGLAVLRDVLARYRAGGSAVTPEEAAAVTVALRDLRIRDDAWSRMEPEHADAHLRLWTGLTCLAQPGYVAAPASLLAFAAWQAGNGALASVALDRALADQPGYTMAQLLQRAISAGVPPSMATPPMTPQEVADSFDKYGTVPALAIEGTDNYGRPRQIFADVLAALSESAYLRLAERCIWLSAYASGNPRSDYHWQADACYDEAQRRGKPELYRKAWKRASGTSAE